MRGANVTIFHKPSKGRDWLRVTGHTSSYTHLNIRQNQHLSIIKLNYNNLRPFAILLTKPLF